MMQKVNDRQLKNLVEAAIFVADAPLTLEMMKTTFLSDFSVSAQQLKKVLKELELDYSNRGIRLLKVASGYRFQSDESLGLVLSKLWQENAPRYSRAMLETLALIAYRQPITRGEIEEVRGVAVSSNIVKSLTERGWVKVIGHKEVPGRPALLATTKTFLDYFSLSSLAELPSAEMFEENLQHAMDASEAVETELAQSHIDNKVEIETDEVSTGSLPDNEQLH